MTHRFFKPPSLRPPRQQGFLTSLGVSPKRTYLSSLLNTDAQFETAIASYSMDGAEFKLQAARQAEAVALARKATLLPLLNQNLDLVQSATRTISAEERHRSAAAAGFNQVRPRAQIAQMVSCVGLVF